MQTHPTQPVEQFAHRKEILSEEEVNGKSHNIWNSDTLRDLENEANDKNLISKLSSPPLAVHTLAVLSAKALWVPQRLV